VRLALASLAVASLLAACGGEGGTVPGDDLPAMRAHDQPRPAVEPARLPARDTREVVGQGFTLHAPSVFQRRGNAGGGSARLVLERPSSSASLPARVVVLREPHPKNDVVEQAYAAEVTMRTTKGVSDLLRSDATWPGARRAVLLQWTQDVAAPKGSSGGPTRARFWQLNLQVRADLILVGVAVAPVDDFDASGVGDVLRSLHPDG
jgi:hypothetical protein